MGQRWGGGDVLDVGFRKSRERCVPESYVLNGWLSIFLILAHTKKKEHRGSGPQVFLLWVEISDDLLKNCVIYEISQQTQIRLSKGSVAKRK